MNATPGGRCCLRWQRPMRRASVLAAVAAGVAMLAAACGNGGSTPTGSSRSHPPGYQQYQEYSACMRSHGAPFWPEPSQVPQGVWDNPNTYVISPQILAEEHGPSWQSALAACQKLAPRQLPYTAAQVSELRSRLMKLAACMRRHGISRFPNPQTGPYGAGFPSPAVGVSPDSAQFRGAQQACWVYAPGS